MIVAVECAEVGVVVLDGPEFNGQVRRARGEEGAFWVPGGVMDRFGVAFESSFEFAGFVVLER